MSYKDHIENQSSDSNDIVCVLPQAAGLSAPLLQQRRQAAAGYFDTIQAKTIPVG